MACWDCLGSAGIDPTMPGLATSLPRGVDRAPGPLFLLPGPCRLRRTCAQTPQGPFWQPQTRTGWRRGMAKRCDFESYVQMALHDLKDA